ncbi:MAG: AI-2E family transporter [Rhodoferax sp.]|jgi:predicted PurR-regulated permease PerM|nr:AI-2E family transporter [Rhodoferax sp.]
MDNPTGSFTPRRLILALLLGGLLVLAYSVLHLFLVPIAWAAIMAYATWPLNMRLRRALGGRATLGAAVMTLLLTLAIALPLLWLISVLRTELGSAYAAVAAYLAQGPKPLPDVVRAIPWLGDWLQESLDHLAANPAALREQIGVWMEQRTGELLELLGGVGRNAARLGLALLTVLFLYRDGEKLLAQVRHVLGRFVGQRVEGYLSAVGATTRAVVYGLVLTAIAQGALAGLGYWVAGVQSPMLLAVITTLIALIPFGTPFVWGSIGVWLLLTGKTAAGIGLLIWGTVVVSWVDNLIRPIVISNATQIPFLLVMFGVLGGVAAFGLVGLFIGPVVLAVMMAVWREWLGQQAGH